MKSNLLIISVLMVMAVPIRAASTNQIAALARLAAISNAGNPPQASPIATNKPAWESRLSFGLTLTRGNSDTLLANSTFTTHRNNPTNEWTFGADAAYGKNNSVENNETLHGFGQYNHLFNERWYGYLRADALHDGISEVKYRVTFSPGAGYYFIRTKATLLAGEVGPGVIFERLDGEDHTYMTSRFAERFEHKFASQARLWQRAEVLPQVDRWGNFLANAELGAEAALTKQLNLRTVVQDSYANEPAPGRRDNDVQLISGLVYRF